MFTYQNSGNKNSIDLNGLSWELDEVVMLACKEPGTQ